MAGSKNRTIKLARPAVGKREERVFARRTKAARQTVHGIDRLVRNVRTGRFERSLSALTAGGAVAVAAEIFFEHDKANFGNKWMWVPIMLGPIGAVAGVTGEVSHRAAKALRPIVAATIIANGLQGLWLHGRGIRQKPDGWKNFCCNMEMDHRSWRRSSSRSSTECACWQRSCGGKNERAATGAH